MQTLEPTLDLSDINIYQGLFMYLLDITVTDKLVIVTPSIASYR